MKGNLKQSFLFHLGIVIAIFILLYMSFFASLHYFTRHGEEIVIPDVRGNDLNTAITKLKTMKFEVYVDSTYEPEQKPLVVLKQVPDTGSIVKQGRTVFLTVNKLSPPHIPMPSLVNLSYRSAIMLLHNNKLLLGDTTYKPDIAAGAILEMNYKGQPIKAGELIAQGSKVSLVIGDGLGNTEFNVPQFTGQTVDQALATINALNLQPIYAVPPDQPKITDTLDATIVDQEPKELNQAGAHNRIKAGDFISLIILQNPN
jgi:eukaryotic-like serine/threonine-protein kinase